MSQTVQMYGASVRGPRNQRDGRANQDAWVKASGTFGHLIGVCDGVGSCSNADVGARAACRALRQAASHWPGGSASPKHLVRLVEILWRLELGNEDATECACTCMFALRSADGGLLLAGIGDGLAMIREGGKLATFGGRGSGVFGNDTLALGAPHRIDDWWIAARAPSSGRAVVLATDGVADDLENDRRGAFVDWMCGEVGELAPAARWHRLRRELRQWPVPNHVDDKTIAAMVEVERA